MLTGLPDILASVVRTQSQTRMKGLIVSSAQSVTALTTAKNAMKVLSTNTSQWKQCIHLVHRK